MKLPTYRDALKLGEDALKEVLAPAKARSAKKKAELEMCKIEEEIATKQSELHGECCKADVSFTRIIDLSDKIALLERRRKQYNKILEEMFPDD